MKVDRHNYEEYFLLYTDNELTVDQKKQVELFIKENPDLEEELVMLQQSRLIPDTIVFEEKHLLMKEENNSFINLNNYEEWLVLYVDNELGENEKMTLEKFVAAHPHVQEELDLFKQTKLQPDQLSFSNKNLLYRNGERIRIISMAWWRVAAAAILIIAAGITLYSILGKKNNIGPEDKFATKEKIQIPVKAILPNQQHQNRDNPVIKREENQIVLSTPVVKTKQKENKKELNNNLSLSIDGQSMVNSNMPQKRLVVVNEVNDVKPRDPQMSNVDVPGKRQQIFNDKVVTPDRAETLNLPEYASSTENKRFRGFFRKATRLIERTSGINPANDDNRVLIGGMAINLK